MGSPREYFLNIYDRAVHSDFLIHWTGKDIDEKHDEDWFTRSHRSCKSNDLTRHYTDRLKNILTYGLWMTKETVPEYTVGRETIVFPPTPQCCFTELKISDSRRHAAQYGRLGIGVKRPFVFNRFGRPLAYFGYGGDKTNDKFLEACAQHLHDKKLLNFFKPMNSDRTRLTYDIYSESEWRILFFDQLLANKKIIDPRDRGNAKEHAYFCSLPPEQQDKLRYLIPLDGWFAMIIYPSLAVKNQAQWDTKLGIRGEIERIKGDMSDNGNKAEDLGKIGKGNWPIETHLDSCRMF